MCETATSVSTENFGRASSIEISRISSLVTSFQTIQYKTLCAAAKLQKFVCEETDNMSV